MKLNKKTIDKMKDSEVRKMLVEIVEKLEELSNDDFFGTEGWEKFFGYED